MRSGGPFSMSSKHKRNSVLGFAFAQLPLLCCKFSYHIVSSVVRRCWRSFSFKLYVKNTLDHVHLFVEFLRLVECSVRIAVLATSGITEVLSNIELVVVDLHNCLLVEPLYALTCLP